MHGDGDPAWGGFGAVPFGAGTPMGRIPGAPAGARVCQTHAAQA